MPRQSGARLGWVDANLTASGFLQGAGWAAGAAAIGLIALHPVIVAGAVVASATSCQRDRPDRDPAQEQQQNDRTNGGPGVGMIGTGEAELQRGGCWPQKIGMAVSFERGTFGPNQVSGATNVQKDHVATPEKAGAP
jgi:hypothetical protein